MAFSKVVLPPEVIGILQISIALKLQYRIAIAGPCAG
jgi:hypothetical protein